MCTSPHHKSRNLTLTIPRWSPLHELVPETPLRHGHAISIDMAYTATVGMEMGLLSKDEHAKLMKLFSRAGLSIDHPDFDEETLEKATTAILKTRDGQLRLATPGPLGKCTFVNDYTLENLKRILRLHKKIIKGYPRHGAGIEAYVDASDTGDTKYNKGEIKQSIQAHAKEGLKEVNGSHPKYELANGHTNGHANGVTNRINGYRENGDVVNGYTNGTH